MTIEGWQIVGDVVGHVVWPFVVLGIALIFRRQLAGLLSDVEEADWGGAKLKLGTRRSKELQKEVKDAAEDDSAEIITPGEGEGEGDVGGDKPSDTGADSVPDSVRFLAYYGRTVVDRLNSSDYNTDTTSVRLGAEIVGSTYADLKQAVRVVAFVTRNSGGRRGVIPSFAKNLDVLQLPAELDSEIRKARQFAIDVTEKRIKVQGEGASAYIDSVASLVGRLVNWAQKQAS